MSAERTEELSEPRVDRTLPVSVSVSVSDDKRNGTDTSHSDTSEERAEPARRETTDGPKEAPGKDKDTASSNNKERVSQGAEISPTKERMRGRLPALVDDADVGVPKQYIVTRDGKADLRFEGVLLASAAPASAPEGRWEEYRIYQTNGGKHVFSKVTRSVLEKDEDTHEADVFDPAPSSVPSQLIRSAREIARARPLTWMDAAAAFFGYTPLAKALYRKLSVRFEEEIS
jgi:hypothetical protein